MGYFVLALVGFACGGLAVFFALDSKRRRVEELRRENELASRKNEQDSIDVQNREKQLNEQMHARRAELAQQLQERLAKFREHEQQLNAKALALDEARKEFELRVISYKELHDENGVLKTDLRNLAIQLQKLLLDYHLQEKSQSEIAARVEEFGARYLKESVKWIGNSLNANNFALCKKRLDEVIARCREIGFQITRTDEESYISNLKAEYEKEVRAAFEREEQARIKAQIREEQKFEREVQREQGRLERERAILQEALARALATAADEHSAEIEDLKARLAEAEAKQRAISQAQLTKAGFVYVISNIGSFGEGVFKIGMTRRLEPLDRVRELGSASVPFPFDVHMMISCQNAPVLETALHKAFVRQQVNKTNPRKEFFRTDIESIAKIVKENHGDVEYVADCEALQYRQSLNMADEDLHYIAQVYDEFDDADEDEDGELAEGTASGNAGAFVSSGS